MTGWKWSVLYINFNDKNNCYCSYTYYYNGTLITNITKTNIVFAINNNNNKLCAAAAAAAAAPTTTTNTTCSKTTTMTYINNNNKYNTN